MSFLNQLKSQASALQNQGALQAQNADANTVQAELRGNAALGPLSLHGSATLQVQQSDKQGNSTQSLLNEA